MSGGRMPSQVPPVKRPEVVEPHKVVDLEHGEGSDIVTVLMELLHGANFNDPPALNTPPFERLLGS